MQVIEKIQEIIKNIQIDNSALSVRHVNYPIPYQSTDTLATLKKLPETIQYNYLSILLRNLIFDIYFSGEITLKNNQSDRVDPDFELELENTAAEVDWGFYEQLHQNNLSKGWWNPGFLITKQEKNGCLAVQKKGATVYIEREKHLCLEEQSATVGDLVSVYTPSGRVLYKYYMAFGNLASFYENSPAFIYFNFSCTAAIKFMNSLTKMLNEIHVPFCFNVLHNPSNYGRYDSGYLRIDKESYPIVRPVLQTVYQENACQFQTQVPIFTKMLAPGLGLAENPDPKYEFSFREEFGMNRCQIIANALIEAHKNVDESPEARMKYIIQHFERFGIDLERPYLNPDSEDIYTTL